MNTDKVYHYVYRITNIVEQKHYYGKRSSKVSPILDLGILYFSSSKDKKFIEDQKTTPCKFYYKVVKVFGTAEKAVAFECRLHKKFLVSTNPKFYNKAIQTSSKFDTSGKVLTEAHKKAISKANKGKVVLPETRQKISRANKGKSPFSKGKKLSKNHIKNLCKAQTGIKNPSAKLANIYNKSTGILVAHNVVLSIWAKDNGYANTALQATANGNRKSHKGLYATYL